MRLPVYFGVHWHKNLDQPDVSKPTTSKMLYRTDKNTLYEQLHQQIHDAARYISYANLEETVIYDGDPESKIMFIGEAPGAEEAEQKKPFVGRSGQLLQTMLNAAGLQRNLIYITNVMLWRPPMNRPPLPQEIATLQPILFEHIQIIQPTILILVGGIAYKALTSSVNIISKVRGQWFSTHLCKNIMPIFHPSFLLRSPIHKKYTWQDIMHISILAHKLGLNIGKTCLRMPCLSND